MTSGGGAAEAIGGGRRHSAIAGTASGVELLNMQRALRGDGGGPSGEYGGAEDRFFSNVASLQHMRHEGGINHGETSEGRKDGEGKKADNGQERIAAWLRDSIDVGEGVGSAALAGISLLAKVDSSDSPRSPASCRREGHSARRASLPLPADVLATETYRAITSAEAKGREHRERQAATQGILQQLPSRLDVAAGVRASSLPLRGEAAATATAQKVLRAETDNDLFQAGSLSMDPEPSPSLERPTAPQQRGQPQQQRSCPPSPGGGTPGQQLRPTSPSVSMVDLSPFAAASRQRSASPRRPPAGSPRGSWSIAAGHPDHPSFGILGSIGDQPLGTPTVSSGGASRPLSPTPIAPMTRKISGIGGVGSLTSLTSAATLSHRPSSSKGAIATSIESLKAAVARGMMMGRQQGESSASISSGGAATGPASGAAGALSAAVPPSAAKIGAAGKVQQAQHHTARSPNF